MSGNLVSVCLTLTVPHVRVRSEEPAMDEVMIGTSPLADQGGLSMTGQTHVQVESAAEKGFISSR